MILVAQIKAARALLEWTQEDLAHAAGLSKPLINTLERGIAHPKADTLQAIQRAFEDSGVEFLDGPGVRLKSVPLRVTIFEGEDCLLDLTNDIFDTLIGTDGEALIAGVDESKYIAFGGARVLAAFAKQTEHGIWRKILIREGDTNFVIPKVYYRWVSEKFFSSIPYYVYGDKYALLLWGPPQKVVMIENAEIAETYRQQFMAYWEASRDPP